MRPPVDCPLEMAVTEAALGGRWALESMQELQGHAESCAVCGEVVQVAQLLRDDREAAIGRARVPAPGQVWWRAVVRARLETAQSASRPITWMQGGSAACILGVACAVAALLWPSVRQAFSLAAGLAVNVEPAALTAATSLLQTVMGSLPLILGVAVWVVLAPLVALYFALSDGE